MSANIVVISAAVLPQVQSVNGQTGIISLNLTGDVTSPAGSFVTTLATVNGNVGSFGDASHTVSLTLDAKGRVTAASANSIAIAASQITSGTLPTAAVPALTGDVTNSAGQLAATVVKINGVALGSTTATSGNILVANGTQWVSVAASGDISVASSGAHTLATVNSNTGSFGSASQVASITVNGKGLITAASNVTITPAAIGAIANSLLTTTGDIIYASAASTPARLAGASGVLQSTGAAAPAWTQSPSLTNPTMQVPTLTPQADPGSPSNGNVWASSGQNALSSEQAGLKEYLSGCIFAATADGVTAGTSASSMLGTGIGTKTLPANFFVPGKTIRIKGFGTVTTQATPGTISVQLSLGGTNLVAGPALTLGASSTFQVRFELWLTCRTNGASGSFIGYGNFDYATGGNTAETSLLGNTVSVTSSINTTGSLLADVNSTNSVSGATVFTIRAATIEVVM